MAEGNGSNKAQLPPEPVTLPVPSRELSMSPWVSPDLWQKYNEQFRPGDLIEFHRDGKYFQHWGLYLGDNLVVHVSSFDLWNPFAGFGENLMNASQASTNVSKIVPVPGAKAVAIELQELASDIKEALSGSSENALARPLCVHCDDLVVEASPLDLGYKLDDRTKWFIKVEHILRIAGRDQFRVNNVAHRVHRHMARTIKEIFQLVNYFKDKEVDYSLMSKNCEHFVTSLKYKMDAKEEEDVVPVVITACGTSSQVRRVVTGISMALVAMGALAAAAVVSLISNPNTTKSDRVDSKKPSVSSHAAEIANSVMANKS